LESVASPKERKLYDKHKDWFEDPESESENFMPNDNSVPYFILLWEILTLLHRMGADSSDNLLDAYNSFGVVMIHYFTSQSASSALAMLKSLPITYVGGVDIAAAISAYVNNPGRFRNDTMGFDSAKYCPHHIRTLPRACRIFSTTLEVACSFTIYNLSGKRLAAALASLHAIENSITTLLKDARFCRPGTEGMSVAESIAWSSLIGRGKLYEPGWGRNDHSVPRILNELMGWRTAQLEDLAPRSWAITTDVQNLL